MFQSQVLRGNNWEKLGETKYLGIAMDRSIHINNQSGKSTRVLNEKNLQIVLWEKRTI